MAGTGRTVASRNGNKKTKAKKAPKRKMSQKAKKSRKA